MWARGNYSFGKKDEDSLSPSFDADQYALLGRPRLSLVAKARSIGAALAYGNSTVEFNPSDEGSLDTESWALSMYGSLYAKKNFYFDAILNVADSGYQAERNITYVDGFGLVSSRCQRRHRRAHDERRTLGAAMTSSSADLTISPTLGVFYIDAQIDEFTETGARGLNLIYDEQKFKSLTGTLGMRMTFAWNLPWGVLLPHFRADYVREFEDDVDVFGIRFAADPNADEHSADSRRNQNIRILRTSGSRRASPRSSGTASPDYVEYQRLEGYRVHQLPGREPRLAVPERRFDGSVTVRATHFTLCGECVRDGHCQHRLQDHSAQRTVPHESREKSFMMKVRRIFGPRGSRWRPPIGRRLRRGTFRIGTEGGRDEGHGEALGSRDRRLLVAWPGAAAR